MSTPARPPRSETRCQPLLSASESRGWLHAPVGSEQSPPQAGPLTTTFVVRVKRCASSASSTAFYCKASNTTPCAGQRSQDRCLAWGSHHDSRRSSTRRSESPTRRSGGLHKTVGGLPQGAVRHCSRFRSCCPSRVRCCVLPFQMCRIDLVPLAQSPHKNIPNRGQIWLFLVHYSMDNLIICYDDV